MTLPDGRRVCLVTHGDPDGQPVFFFHGTPASRLGHEFTSEPAKEQGIRVLCPDRPGIGRSDPKPGRTIADYATDVKDIALALGLGRYGVVGYSGGGPYALACGAADTRSGRRRRGDGGCGPGRRSARARRAREERHPDAQARGRSDRVSPGSSCGSS